MGKVYTRFILKATDFNDLLGSRAKPTPQERRQIVIASEARRHERRSRAQLELARTWRAKRHHGSAKIKAPGKDFPDAGRTAPLAVSYDQKPAIRR